MDKNNIEEIEILDEKLIIGDLKLKTGKEYKIKVKTTMGKIYAQLFDETCTEPLKEVDYQGKGPYNTEIKGKTDINGIIKHNNIPIGVYEIKIKDEDDEFTVKIPTVDHEEKEAQPIIINNYQLSEEFNDDDLEDEDINKDGGLYPFDDEHEEELNEEFEED